ncbi:MAG: hypothetical protein CO117_06255 [Flavobacteriaceae bacterium CG_4_9_14_3_um_filter_33_16]|nr:MAG: hypothetical protein CO117_06255 [Flavobacteriaceae bacterium CG_4_9_14_3_um_filter_33_16]
MYECEICNRIFAKERFLKLHLRYNKNHDGNIMYGGRANIEGNFKSFKDPSITEEEKRKQILIAKKGGLAAPGKSLDPFKEEERKRKISEYMKGNKHATHRGDRQSYYKNIRMDSKWENGVAKWLDDNKIVWKYSEKGFKLSDNRIYYPDFFIYDLNNNFLKLIEVKGYFRLENQIKFKMFREEYPNINVELWGKDILYQNNIITKEGYVKNL